MTHFADDTAIDILVELTLNMIENLAYTPEPKVHMWLLILVSRDCDSSSKMIEN